MASVKAFIRVSAKRKSVAVRFRVSDGRNVQLFYKSDILVDPTAWDEKKECIKAKVMYSGIERILFDESVNNMKSILLKVYQEAEDKKSLTSEDLRLLVDMKQHPEKYKKEEDNSERDFFEQFDYFLQVKNYPESDNKNYLTQIKLLRRYELYKSLQDGVEWKLSFDNINVEIIREIEDFYRNEYKIVKHKTYKVIYKEIPPRRTPNVRGENTIAKFMKRFRTYIKWCMKEGLLSDDPYIGYEQKSPVYGTPYYMTIDERTKIAETDLYEAWKKLPKEDKERIKESSLPQMEKQRDIFIFQCMIGCRVGDLLNFTPQNLIDGKISYIARKTSGEVRDAIEVPLNELARSHLARRTFIGNLYKKVQDPNLIGKLSGHVEGSRAFARYRTIDDEI